MRRSFLLLLCLGSLSFAQDSGSIGGTVVDKENGEPLISASVRVEGTAMVAFADVNGQFNFRNVAPGTYSVTATFDSFAALTVKDVVVKAGEHTKIDMGMEPDALQESMVVSVELAENTEVSLLKHRQKSSSISDAIGGEEISRGGGGNAADAVSKITGASVVGGKYVFIRGLGDRYTSTHLNGVEMPTADPDTKAFQADLFPSSILDNIVTVKSFTPEKPGNFSGGIVDIGTKSFPNKLTINLSVKGSYNSQVTGEDNMLHYDGGSAWQGSDDGTRALPDLLENGDAAIPTLIEARRDEAAAQRLDAISRSFGNTMVPTNRKGPLNQGYSVSLGNRIPVFGREFGFLTSFSYSRKQSGYNDRTMARWKLTESSAVADTLASQSNFTAREGKDSVNWGGLATMNYNISSNHQINFNALYTQSGDSVAHEYAGTWFEQFTNPETQLESRLLKYSERNLTSYQLGGEHAFGPQAGVILNWKVSDSSTSLDEPDTRIFTNHVTPRQTQDGLQNIYSIARSNYNNPARYWRTLEEDGSAYSADVDIDIPSFNSQRGKVKVGLSSDQKERAFNELRYEYAFDSGIRYDGTSDSIFGEDIVGLQGYNEQRNRYEFGSVLQLSPDARGGNYTGDMTIDAYYAMVELPINERIKVITGARFEQADMEVLNNTTTGELDDDDVLPSFNLIYETPNNTNLRFSYGRTLARPNFREKAPYASYDFIADGIFVGNPDLERTLIDNYDIRWERFPRAGELFAASVFYKDFENPIERAYNIRTTSDFGEKTFLNVPAATVYGLELEVRKRFDQAVLDGDSNHIFSIGANASFIESEVDIPEEELDFIRQRDPDHPATRTLQGQSPFLINLSLNYDSADGKTAASVYYNVFGERLDQVGVGGAPDALEQSRHMLDFTFSQQLYQSLKLKFVAKNLMDDPIEIAQKFKGEKFTQTYYKTGTSYSMSLSYKP